MSTPIALWLAEKLEDPESAHGYRLVANNAADELRRLHEENEQLKAQHTWVGLTNDEVNNIAAGCHLGNSVQDAIFRAEQIIKEKNT